MTDPTPVPDPERPIEPSEEPVPTAPDPERPILPEEPPTEIVPDPDRPVLPDDDEFCADRDHHHLPHRGFAGL